MSRVHAARPAPSVAQAPSHDSGIASVGSSPSRARHRLGGFDIRPAPEGSSSAAPTSPNAPIQGFLSWFTGGKSKKPSPTKGYDYFSNTKDVIDGYNTGYGDIHSIMAEDNKMSEPPSSPWSLFGMGLGRFHGLYNQQQQHKGRLETEDHNRRMIEQTPPMTGNGAYLEHLHKKTLAMQAVNKMFTPKKDEN